MVRNECQLSSSLQDKTNLRKMLRFLDCTLDVRFIQRATSPQWGVRENLNVGFGIAFICRFLDS